MNQMNRTAYHVLRVGLAVTFLWIGILIFKEPESWGLTYLQPWAAGLLPIPLRQAMIGTAILDLAIGFLLLTGLGVWAGALVGGAHLIIVLTVSGITAVTTRDIGLLAAVAALFIESFPWNIIRKYWPRKSTIGTTTLPNIKKG